MSRAGTRPVVVGVDGSSGAARAAVAATEEARLREAPLVVVSAAPWPRGGIGTFPTRGVDLPGLVQTGAETLAAAVAAEAEAVLGAGRVSWQVSGAGPVEALREAAAAVREVVVRERTVAALTAAGLTAQLLVVGHRRRRLARLGSTTHGVLHRAGCPVAVVPLVEGTR